MRVSGDNNPGLYSLNVQPGLSKYMCIHLYENIKEQVSQEEPTSTYWEYDEYSLIVPNKENLEADIVNRREQWLLTAKSMEHKQDAIQQEIETNKLQRTIEAGAVLAQEATTEPSATVGIFAAGFPQWEPGMYFDKQYSLFQYKGDVGFTRQSGILAMEHQPPFSPGMESIYGIRPTPDDEGIYPYRYNMAASKGMQIRDEDGLIWYCYNTIDPLLWPPSEVPAHFQKAE